MLFIRPAIRSAGRRFERLRCSDREEVALDRALDRRRRPAGRAAARATAAARPSGRSRAPAARARSRRPPRAARCRTTAAVCGCSACRKLASVGDRRVVQPLPDRADLAPLPPVEQPLHLVLVVEHRGQQLPRRLGAAGDLRAGGQELEELDDHRVEHLLADLAEPADRAGEARHVGLGQLAQEARGELRPDRGQDHRRLLDRRSASRSTRSAGSRGFGLGRAGTRAVSALIVRSSGPWRRRAGSSRRR